MKRPFAILFTMMVLLAMTACGSTASETVADDEKSSSDTIKIKLATVGPESGTVQAEAEHVLMDYIEKASNGAIEVDYYPNSVLGGDLDLAEGLSNGSIQLATLQSSVLTSYSDNFGILDMPFLFNSSSAALQALNEGELASILKNSLKGTGICFSNYWGFGGYRGLSNSIRPVETPEDMHGLKIRVMESPVYITAFTLLGANPTPISFSELFTALQNKTVDGQDNDPSLTYTSKFYEVQPYYTDLEHVLSVSNMYMSEDWYNGLSDEYKAIIDEACKQFSDYCTDAGLKAYEDNLSLLADAGVKVTRLTPENRKLFQGTVAPMYDEYIERWGQEIFDAARAYNN